MTTLRDAGVDIAVGDAASRTAFLYAQKTFAARAGLIGEPHAEEGGFTGLLDFGKFYLAMNADGVGTKIAIARNLGNFDGLGSDLLAMVADDAVCVGAETISITNTFDTDKVRPDEIEKMMKSLSEACIEQEVVIAGGEIAEMNALANGTMWNATSIGIVNKDKVIDAKNVEVGDAVIALREKGLRSNGFSLVRKIIADQKLGYEMEKQALEPSKVYSAGVLALHGRFDQEAKIAIKAIAHITGGGIAGNIVRVLKKNKLGVRLEEIYPPSAWVKTLQEAGKVEDREAYKTWNMGNGMMIVVGQKEADQAVALLREQNIEAKICGVITKNPQIILRNHGAVGKEKFLTFE